MLEETPLNVQINYIIWRISAASLSYLDERAEDVAFRFSSMLSGQRQRPPRWRKCVAEAGVNILAKFRTKNRRFEH